LAKSLRAAAANPTAAVKFLDYAPDPGVGGLFPQRIRQTQGGFPVLDLKVTSVATGVVDINVPANVKTFAENVAVQPAAPGVWFLAGGSHNSVAIELSDQIVLVESPLYEGRALAVIAAANQLVPGKTVKTVINSHHHFDHTGGLRATVGAGAQLITSAQASPTSNASSPTPSASRPTTWRKAAASPASWVSTLAPCCATPCERSRCTTCWAACARRAS